MSKTEMAQQLRLEGDASDPYFYGRRQLIRYDKTGQPSYQWQALTADDFLNPQAEDEFVHGPYHDDLVRSLCRHFRYHHRYNPQTLVVSQMKFVWARPELAQPTPDLALIPQVDEPERFRTHFDVAAEGVAPRFILEVTSPRFAKQDLVDKVAIYAAAGVNEYWIIDAQVDDPASDVETATPRLRVLGYQLEAGRYASIQADGEGRFYSAANRLWLHLNATHDEIELLDERSGRKIVPSADFVEPSPAAPAEAASRAQSIADQLDLSGFDLE